MNWLLVLAPFVTGVAAAMGFAAAVRAVWRRRPERRKPSKRWAWRLASVGVGAVAMAGFVAIVGRLLPATHTVTRSARYAATPEAVWRLVSDFPTHHTWRPGLRAVRRLPDRNGHAVWNVVGDWGPCIPFPIEFCEIEPPVLQHKLMDLDLEVEAFSPPHLMRTRNLDDDIPFGGAWTWELSPEQGGCRVRITEDGFIKPGPYRYLSRTFGCTRTMEEYLKALGARLGERPLIES